MHTKTHKRFQATTAIDIEKSQRPRAKLTLKPKPLTKIESAAPLILTRLDVPAYLLSEPSAKGGIRSLVLYNGDSAAMLARHAPHHPFRTLVKVKVNGTWQRHAKALTPGPLHASINAAQTFLLRHGTQWQHDSNDANERAIRLLQILDVSLPLQPDVGLVSALIHGAHFARAFDSAFQVRPPLNGKTAREASLSELQRAS